MVDSDLNVGTAPDVTVLGDDASPDQVRATFRALRHLNDTLIRTVSYDDRVLVLISACIGHGMNTRNRIVGAIHKLNYNRVRVAKAVDAGVGSRWRIDYDGRYHNLV